MHLIFVIHTRASRRRRNANTNKAPATPPITGLISATLTPGLDAMVINIVVDPAVVLPVGTCESVTENMIDDMISVDDNPDNAYNNETACM